MNSIKSIKLENFQSYINATIRPAPNGELSVVTGASDSGKTAILRALRWVFFNTPSGTDFIRVGATFARITVEFESGDTIIRWRSTGSINRYMVNGETYEGFGANVPLEVSQVSGIRPVQIGDLNVNLNLAEQLDGPFLGKSISAGARAKVLGKLAGTEEIDFAGKQLSTDLYRRNQDEKRLAVEVAGLEEKIKEYDWLPGMARKIEVLEGLIVKIRSTRERLMQLEHKRDKYNVARENIYECKAKIERWQGIEQAESILSAAVGKKQLSESIKALVDRLQGILGNIYYAKLRLAKWRNLPQAEGLFQEAQTRAQVVRQLRSLRNSYLAGMEIIRCSQDAMNSLQGLGAAEALLQDVSEKKRARKTLEALSARWAVTNAAVISTQKRLNNLASIDAAETKIASLLEKTNLWKVLSNFSAQYDNKHLSIIGARENVVLWENRLAELQGAYHDLLADVGICPLCGQEIKFKVKEAV